MEIEFKDPNFKMACLDILFDEGLFSDELADILEKNPESEFDEYEVNPKRLECFLDLPVTQEHLDLITSFAPDGGDDIYSYLMPAWSGEEEELELNSLEDLQYLRNLEKLFIYAVVKEKCLDLKSCLGLEKLQKIKIYKFYFIEESWETSLQELKNKNIEIEI
ncbi:MAG: hypothetical protein HRT89_12420 [Lentisphaeria bacterium]|nr:hypothetical protein [Lentisphaeria bacterium]NQZ68861.1 hypothetical protein [Lentisphaeria bacterium]